MRSRLLFQYPGSKLQLAQLYEPYYPVHNTFVSLFGGSGAEIVSKQPSTLEIFNDRDDHVVSVFRVLQDEQERRKLIRRIRNTPPSRTIVDECRNKLSQPEHLTQIETAYSFLVCTNFQFGGLVHHARFSPKGKKAGRFHSLPRAIASFQKRFRRVTIENLDWRIALKKYDAEDTFFFVDSPYHPETLNAHSQLYRHVLSAEEHDELLQLVQRVKGKVLLCGYSHPSYTERLFHWRNFKFDRKAIMSTKKPKRQENIWLNYEKDGTKIPRNKLEVAKRYAALLGEDAEHFLQLVRRVQAIHSPPQK